MYIPTYRARENWWKRKDFHNAFFIIAWRSEMWGIGQLWLLHQASPVVSTQDWPSCAICDDDASWQQPSGQIFMNTSAIHTHYSRRIGRNTSHSRKSLCWGEEGFAGGLPGGDGLLSVYRVCYPVPLDCWGAPGVSQQQQQKPASSVGRLVQNCYAQCNVVTGLDRTRCTPLI